VVILICFGQLIMSLPSCTVRLRQDSVFQPVSNEILIADEVILSYLAVYSYSSRFSHLLFIDPSKLVPVVIVLGFNH